MPPTPAAEALARSLRAIIALRQQRVHFRNASDVKGLKFPVSFFVGEALVLQLHRLSTAGPLLTGMSKKNNLSTRKRQHKTDLEREKQAAIKKKQKAEKKLEGKMGAGLAKKTTFKKKKGIKIRKNMTIRGIKVVDSESRQAALAALQEEAENRMDQD